MIFPLLKLRKKDFLTSSFCCRMVSCFGFSIAGGQPKHQHLNPNVFKSSLNILLLMGRFVKGQDDHPAVTFLLTLGFHPLIPTLRSLLSGWEVLFQRDVWSNLRRDGCFKAKPQSWRLDPNITNLLVLDCLSLYILGFPALLFRKPSPGWMGSANSPCIQTPCLIPTSINDSLSRLPFVAPEAHVDQAFQERWDWGWFVLISW